MVTFADYPDPRILDAALTVASDPATTRAARVAALQIVAKQVYGFDSEITGFSSKGNVVQVKPYAEPFDRCSVIGVPGLVDRPPEPPQSALPLARSRLALAASADERDSVVRIIARCIVAR